MPVAYQAEMRPLKAPKIIETMIALVAAVCVVVASQGVRADGPASIAVKRLFAPASDIERGVVVLPDPSATTTSSRVMVREGNFTRAQRGSGSTVRFGFEHGGGPLRIVALGRDSYRWIGELRMEGESIPLRGGGGIALRVSESFGSQALVGFDEPASVFEVELPAGSVGLEFRAPVPEGTPAAIVVADPSEDSLEVRLVSRVQRANLPLWLRISGKTAGVAPLGGVALGFAVDSARITWSDGVRESGFVDATDPGLVRFDRARAGDAVVWIDGRVRSADGTERPRTVLLLTRVVDGAVIAGAPRMSLEPDGWVTLELPLAQARVGEVVFAATELWAGSVGGARPLGWIGGLAAVEQGVGRGGVGGGLESGSTAAFVRIGCDARCIAIEQGETLQCRAVRLQERDGFAPLDLRCMLAPEVDPALEVALARSRTADTGELWRGRPGAASVPIPAVEGFVPPVGSHALVLSHGYCADANTWPLAQFGSDAWRYENFNQNLSHDAFALDIATRAAQFKSYGVIAHSQGGCAALHLFAHYWSGLDWAGAGRLVQTVGTPFEGTALAGNVAALGEIFGIQCGATYDMTYDGAAAWLSTIPTAARARVYTHTTTFTNNPFVYDYCNILSDVLLTDPEDGVTEDWSGHIPGAVNMGLRTGWCHVSGMRDPDQTLDANRNATMNAQGAR